MRVALLSVQVPFERGGAELLAEACKEAMIARNIKAEIVTIPFKWYPPERILDHVQMATLLDLSEANGEKIDKVISLKFPAYFCEHHNKTLWLLHQHRQAYDLFLSPFGDLNLTRAGRRVASKIKKLDTKYLPEHKNLFAISKNVADRLERYNNLSINEVLYPPPKNAQRFHCAAYENYIFYPSRFSSLKRQSLIVRAMVSAPSQLKLVLVGNYQNAYGAEVKALITDLGLEQKVILKNFVSEEELIDLYANCLAVYNGVYDEDYGYVTIEAFLSSKSVIAHSDAGGPLEFVEHGHNGLIVEPNVESIVEALHKLSADLPKTMQYGKNGLESLQQKNISWDYTIEKLLS